MSHLLNRLEPPGTNDHTSVPQTPYTYDMGLGQCGESWGQACVDAGSSCTLHLIHS